MTVKYGKIGRGKNYFIGSKAAADGFVTGHQVLVFPVAFSWASPELRGNLKLKLSPKSLICLIFQEPERPPRA